VLAYHYSTALELARAAGQTEQATELEAPALRFLTLAGERALGLDTATALVDFERALALTPRGHPERPEVLARFAQAALDGGLAEAAAALEEAIETFQERGDIPAASRAMFTLVQVMSSAGDPRTFEIGAEALALLEPLPPGPELVGALIEVARARVLGGESADGVSFAERALALAVELGLPLPARALGYQGLARCNLGDSGGLEDMRRALQIAMDAGQGRETATLYNNLGRALWPFEGPLAALDVYRQGIGFDQARGLAALALWIEASSLDPLADIGELDEVLSEAGRLGERAETAGIVPSLITIRAVQARVLALRGEAGQAEAFLDWLEYAARETGAPEGLAEGLGSSAIARTALGQSDRAAALLNELSSNLQLRAHGSFAAWLAAMVRAAVLIGDPALAERLASGLEPRFPYAEHALVTTNAALSEARGDLEAAADGYADAADRWERFGVVPERAFALLGQGRCLIGFARPTDAAPVLQRAREIFDALGAAPALAETDALLQQATALSS
jgi:tetratricopeptide (TPR) repeat protein